MSIIDASIRDAVLRVGEVSGVEGRKVSVLVDKNKNLSDMFFDGQLLKNVSVSGFLEIRKGFLSIICKVEGERIEDDGRTSQRSSLESFDRSARTLSVSLAGYINDEGRFTPGAKELPLIGNEAFLLTREKLHVIHDLVTAGAPFITVANSFQDEFEVRLPVDGLFNGHIAIFGNTGSGKTNTLAILYQELLKVLEQRNPIAFAQNVRFVLFDFNGEYVGPACITPNKKVYSLSTRVADADRLPLPQDALLDPEVLSILSDATEKTQKPFLRRMLSLYRHVHAVEDGSPADFFRNIVRKRVVETLQMSDKVRAFLLLDYFRELFYLSAVQDPPDLDGDLDWHNQSQEFRLKGEQVYLAQQPHRIPDTRLYQQVAHLGLPNSLLSRLLMFLYLQLITDVISNRAQNEHVAPVINRLKSKKKDIERVFDLEHGAFWVSNFVVVNLHDVNLEMKKTLPLLLCKRLYSDHKAAGAGGALTFIIDEAHNILSTESSREAESWKDYRLETFEEIVKEGRKFGVYLTISSQRPHDISSTITSQAHNYFIHRLINEWDLKAIATSVSYIDRITEESIPALPTGTCVFSGVAGGVPMKLNIKPLQIEARPHSHTRRFSDVVPVIEIDVE